MSEAFNLLEEFIPELVEGKICMDIEARKAARDTIVLTGVYNLDYLVAMLTKMQEKLHSGSRVQLRFARQPYGTIMLAKAWDEGTDTFFPDGKSNRYIGLAPVSTSTSKQGFEVWSEVRGETVTEVKTVVEIVEVPANPETEYGNHATFIDEDQIEEMLTGASE